MYVQKRSTEKNHLMSISGRMYLLWEEGGKAHIRKRVNKDILKKHSKVPHCDVACFPLVFLQFHKAFNVLCFVQVLH